MEIHRLKPMKDGYDKNLFNKLYKETEQLRKTLVYQINPHRFGVTSDIIYSWFDDKFMFVFNKYYGKLDPEVLKGYIINALKTFKFRVLRQAYSKNNIFSDMLSMEESTKAVNTIPEEFDSEDYEFLMGLALGYLKSRLSADAYLILDIELNPPPYISTKLVSLKTKIPAKLIAEYLDLEPNSDSLDFINDLRREIKYWVNEAKYHFSKSSIPS